MRDGEKTVAELMDLGKQFLGRYYHQTSFLVAFFFFFVPLKKSCLCGIANVSWFRRS